MRVTGVEIDGFGIWTNLCLRDLAPDLTVIYGPNEAGKTTLMQFLRAAFYGLSAVPHRRYVPAVHGGRAGGRVHITTLGGQYQIARCWDPSEGNQTSETARLIGPDGQSLGALALVELLGKVDESIFSNVFAVGLSELQELATLNESQAAEELYKLASGVDRVALLDVMASIDKLRTVWLDRKTNKGVLAELAAERQRWLQQSDQASRQARRWSELARKRQELRQSVLALDQSMQDLARRNQLLELALQVRDAWQKQRALQQQLESLHCTAEIPPEAERRVKRLKEMLARRQQRLVQLQQDRRRLADELKRLAWQSAIWKARHRLPHLQEQLSWLKTLQKQCDDLQPEIAKLEQELRQVCQELGISSQVSVQSEMRLDHRTVEYLKKPAQSLRKLHVRLRRLQQQHQEATRREEELRQQWHDALRDLGVDRWQEAREALATRVRKLQQRQELEGQIERLQRQKKDLEEECLTLLKTPLMPLRHILAWGGIVAFGVMLTLIALFSQWVGDFRAPLVLFGLLCTGGGFLLKHAYQQIHSQELEDQQQQLTRVKRQLEQLLHERQTLDAGLASTIPIDQQLQEAQQRLRRLEQLGPLQEQLRAAQAAQESCQKQLKDVQSLLREEKQHWQLALAKLQLPEDLKPGDLRRLVVGHERLNAIRRRLSERRQELQAKQTQMAETKQAIAECLRPLGLALEGDDPWQHVRQFAEAVQLQERTLQTRLRQRQSLRRVRRQAARCQRNIERLRLHCQATFSRFGASREEEFLQLAAQYQRRCALEAERRQWKERIDAILGGRCTLHQIESLLVADVDLPRQIQDVQQQIDQLRQQHAQTLSTLGEIAHEMKTLANDRSWDEARVGLASVEARWQEADRFWKRLALTSALLEQVRIQYENQRQPEALNEASRYLQQLTDNRYRRLWTPLGKRALRVDDHQGRTLELEVLSQGTREAIFLSLRFALVAAYARCGISLPLILDDVMANFDTRRAEASVRTIRQFAAQGHQVLFFTCHEHIANLFRQAQSDVRCLPAEPAPGLVLGPAFVTDIPATQKIASTAASLSSVAYGLQASEVCQIGSKCEPHKSSPAKVGTEDADHHAATQQHGDVGTNDGKIPVSPDSDRYEELVTTAQEASEAAGEALADNAVASDDANDDDTRVRLGESVLETSGDDPTGQSGGPVPEESTSVVAKAVAHRIDPAENGTLKDKRHTKSSHRRQKPTSHGETRRSERRRAQISRQGETPIRASTPASVTPATWWECPR